MVGEARDAWTTQVAPDHVRTAAAVNTQPADETSSDLFCRPSHSGCRGSAGQCPCSPGKRAEIRRRRGGMSETNSQTVQKRKDR